MEPKFKKNQKVWFGPHMGYFSDPDTQPAWEPAVITDVKVNNTIQYKIKGYTGWWQEDFFKERED